MSVKSKPWSDDGQATTTPAAVSLIGPANQLADFLAIRNKAASTNELQISWDGGITYTTTLEAGESFSIEARLAEIHVQSSGTADFEWVATSSGDEG